MLPPSLPPFLPLAPHPCAALGCLSERACFPSARSLSASSRMKAGESSRSFGVPAHLTVAHNWPSVNIG